MVLGMAQGAALEMAALEGSEEPARESAPEPEPEPERDGLDFTFGEYTGLLQVIESLTSLVAADSEILVSVGT